MASAVFASNNAVKWGDNVYNCNYAVSNAVNRAQFNPISNPNPNPCTNVQSRRIQNPNPNPNPNPSPNVQSRRIENPNPNPTRTRPMPPPSGDLVGKEDYVTINLSEYSRAELRELERRLRVELDQVRQVRDRIKNLNVESLPVLMSPKPPETEALCRREKVVGRKRALSSGPNRELKRLVAPVSPELDGLVMKIMKRCSQILGKLMKHKHAWIFNKPVDTVGLGLHDYFEIIDRPMDLGTVKAKLSKKEYKIPSEFASDVRLTFKNAMTYNPKGQDAHIMAEAMLREFAKIFNPAIKKFEAEKGRVLAALGISKTAKIDEPKAVVDKTQRSSREPEPVQDVLPDHRLAEVCAKTSPGSIQRSMPKLPKPTEKHSVKRVMTFDEKEELAMFLQELPSDKMEAMLEILSKRNTRMAREGDEIELDFEILDNETLWELDAFVSNLKAENKARTQAPIENLMLPAQVEKSPVRESTPEMAQQKSTKVDIVEEDVDIGEDILLNTYPPVEIERDTSSSSTGDSLSSSGSGSVSSLGSDSDKDSAQSSFVEPK